MIINTIVGAFGNFGLWLTGGLVVGAALGSAGEPAPAATKECPYCISTIPVQATRCPQCTSELTG